MMKIFIGEFRGIDEEDLKEHIFDAYNVAYDRIEKIDILIAYKFRGGDLTYSSSYFLFAKDAKYYEVRAKHCECYGFENQWKPERIFPEHLKRQTELFNISLYDDRRNEYRKLITQYLADIKEGTRP